MKYIVKVAQPYTIDEVVSEFGLSVVKILPAVSGYLIIDETDNEKIVEMRKSGKFRIIDAEREISRFPEEHNRPIENIGPQDSTSDSQLPALKYWHLNAISNTAGATSVYEEYDFRLDGSGTDIYIIDSGINPDHPDITGRVFSVPGVNSDVEYNLTDTDGHGTTVAIFAAGINAGIARGAHIWSAKWETTNIQIAIALDAVLAHHQNKSNARPSIVNMSFGTNVTSDNPYYHSDEPDNIKPFDEYSTDMAKAMIADGMHVVTAAGNGFENKTNGTFLPMLAELINPAQASITSDVITVGATNTGTYTIGNQSQESPNNEMSVFSNYGRAVTISAPGHRLPHLRYDQTYHFDFSEYVVSSGTSFAAPLVAGVISCWLQEKPSETPANIKSQLVNIASDGLITNLGGTHENTDGVIAWGGDIIQVEDTSASDVEYSVYDYQIDLTTPNKVLFNPWQTYTPVYNNSNLSQISGDTDGNIAPVDLAAVFQTILGEEPYGVQYNYDGGIPGVTIDSNGTLSGTAVPAGDHTLEIEFTNGYQTFSRVFDLNIPSIYDTEWVTFTGRLTVEQV